MVWPIMVALLEVWPDVSRFMAKLSPCRRLMLGPQRYLVNCLKGLVVEGRKAGLGSPPGTCFLEPRAGYSAPLSVTSPVPRLRPASPDAAFRTGCWTSKA